MSAARFISYCPMCGDLDVEVAEGRTWCCGFQVGIPVRPEGSVGVPVAAPRAYAATATNGWPTPADGLVGEQAGQPPVAAHGGMNAPPTPPPTSSMGVERCGPPVAAGRARISEHPTTERTAA